MWSSEFNVLAGVGARRMAPVLSQTPLMAITIAVALIGIFAFGAVYFRLV